MGSPDGVDPLRAVAVREDRPLALSALADLPEMTPLPPESKRDVAVAALAEAMAEQANPLGNMVPSAAMRQRAEKIIDAILDIAGREVVVFLVGSEASASMLATACREATDPIVTSEHLMAADQVITRLARLAQRVG